MKIETRLEKLEHEFKILKNEIQATLLEIHEQLLTQQYPALRADEGASDPFSPARPAPTSAPLRAETVERKERGERTVRPKASPASAGNALPWQDSPLGGYGNGNGSVAHRRSAANMGGRAPGLEAAHNANALPIGTPAFTDLSFENQFGDELEEQVEEAPEHDGFDDDGLDGDGLYGDGLDDDGAGAGAAFSPHTREVSLSDIPRTHGEPAAQARQSSGRNTSPRANFAVLAEWVGLGVRTLGKARTRQAVETYAASGDVSPEAHKTIMQLLALSPEDEPVEPSGPTATIELLVKLDAILNQR